MNCLCNIGGHCVRVSASKVLSSSNCTIPFHLDSKNYKGRFKSLVGKGVELARCENKFYHIGRAMVSLTHLCM